MLYLVATPIGNLKDLTFRAKEILETVDYILCEDTRKSRILMRHYQIATPLRSYHKFNEQRTQDQIIALLKEGKQIALISDAGTPGICDPGERLVRRCHQEAIAVSTLPGPCAAIASLTVTGFEASSFQFIGFLPRKTGALKKTLTLALAYDGTTIAYESPYRILATLKLLAELDPERRVALVRELTKIHEECLIDKSSMLVTKLAAKKIKGEITLLIHQTTTT